MLLSVTPRWSQALLFQSPPLSFQLSGGGGGGGEGVSSQHGDNFSSYLLDHRCQTQGARAKSSVATPDDFAIVRNT